VRKIFIVIVFSLILILSGCNNKMAVRSAKKLQVVAILKEYSALHGYQVAYANNRTGSYRIELGEVQIPGELRTVSTKSQYATENINNGSYYPLTSYEEKSWETYAYSAKQVMLAVIVRVVQKGDDVVITIHPDSQSESLLNNSYGKKFGNFLKESGYQIEFI